jgi:hypothetical protein
VNAERISWRAYDRFMQKYVKSIGDERLGKVPADLDLKPYRDYHDYELMGRMLKHIDRVPGNSAKLRDELKAYAAAFREEHRVEDRRASRKSAVKDKATTANGHGAVSATRKAPAKTAAGGRKAAGRRGKSRPSAT